MEKIFARDILSPSHPLHSAFKKWLDAKEMTLRQARKFFREKINADNRQRSVDH